MQRVAVMPQLAQKHDTVPLQHVNHRAQHLDGRCGLT
jgi:hypothetical protein